MLPVRIILVTCIMAVDAFVIPPPKYHASITLLLAANNKLSHNLFAEPAWPMIQQDLDELPVFACANEQGKAIAYTIDIQDESHKVPFFFCDVDDAVEELQKAKNSTGLPNLSLIPFPLGQALQMWVQDNAVIVPNKKAIQQAGAPAGTNPVGQQEDQLNEVFNTQCGQWLCQSVAEGFK